MFFRSQAFLVHKLRYMLDWFMNSGQEVMPQEIGGREKGLGHNHLLKTKEQFWLLVLETKEEAECCRTLRSKNQSGRS